MNKAALQKDATDVQLSTTEWNSVVTVQKQQPPDVLSSYKGTDVLPTLKVLAFIHTNQHLWHSQDLDIFSVKTKKESWF